MTAEISPGLGVLQRIQEVLADHEYNGAFRDFAGAFQMAGRVECCTCGWQSAGEGVHIAHVASLVLALFTQETQTYGNYETKYESGGEGVFFRYGGQTARYVGRETLTRFVSSWQRES